MNENYEMLVEEIKGSLEQLATLDPSDKGYMENVKSLDTLWKLKLEEDKLKLESDKQQSKKDDDAVEARKAKRDFIKECASIGVTALGIILPIAFYGKWLKTGMQFEETGTFTSKTFQGLTKFFRPTK